MKKIKVLHVITGGLRREGISSTQLEFFKNMDLSKFEIYVAAVHNNEKEMIEEFERYGCNVIEFPDRQENVAKYFHAMVREIGKIKPDILHVHGSSAIMSIELLAAKISGVKIRIAHSRNTKADREKLDKVLRPLFNRLYTDAFACGEDAGRWLFGNRPFTIIHNGKDFQKFVYNERLRNEKRAELNLQDKIVVGHVGRINFQKNHHYLIKMFSSFKKTYPNAVLYLMGDGPLKEELVGEIKDSKLDDSVVLAGSVDDVANRLQAMDIMVFPSRFEGLPNVVLEWQAEGLPCLISDEITPECAPSKLVKFASIKDSPDVWADTMAEMLDVYTDRKKQAEDAVCALKKEGFDIKDAVKQLEQAYEGMVERNK